VQRCKTTFFKSICDRSSKIEPTECEAEGGEEDTSSGSMDSSWGFPPFEFKEASEKAASHLLRIVFASLDPQISGGKLKTAMTVVPISSGCDKLSFKIFSFARI
jgi:hypothetical protein